MPWVDLLDNAQFLRELFPSPPALKAIRILELTLHQDGPRMLLRMNLNEFPATPPRKWVTDAANRVQLTLMGIGIRRLDLKGWGTDNVADLQIERLNGVIRLGVTGESFVVSADFDALRLDSISAYQDGTLATPEGQR